MTDFRTIVSISPSSNKIGLKNGILTIGSCFADAIGLRLDKAKFHARVNPFGATYNPISIHKALSYAIRSEFPSTQTYLTRDELHLNYDFHSSFCAVNKSTLESTIHKAVQGTHQFLKNADWVLITYGTAWIYEQRNTKALVNNCHKIPADHFTKRLLSEQEIAESFKVIYAETKKLNPATKFILTLSPVRHVKDTLPLNSVSKAVVRSACHTISSAYNDVDYFPAFEIMMDDLRDYRFYKSDMLHPTEDAEDYIWQKFMETYFEPATIKFVKEWKSLQASLSHRAFYPQSTGHQKFLKTTLAKLHELKSIVNVDDEIAAVQSQLIEH